MNSSMCLYLKMDYLKAHGQRVNAFGQWVSFHRPVRVSFNPLNLTCIKGSGAEMRPAIASGLVTGDASISYWPIFSPFLSYTPRGLCESKLDRPNFLLMSKML